MKYITLPCVFAYLPVSLLPISPGTLYTLVKLVQVSHAICASCLCTNTSVGIPAHPSRFSLVVTYSDGVEHALVPVTTVVGTCV